jgi:NAD(P)-dependent dehydrogenase (short-subunit alcohol dehydrogenase family)
MQTKITAARYRPLVFTVVALAAILGSLITSVDKTALADGPVHPASPSVLITGANRGIGLELARQYSAAGWHVIGTARQPGTAAELRAVGAEVLQLDVTDQASVDRLARDLAGQPLDILINNAGIQSLMWTLDDIDIEAFKRTLDVNTLGPVRVTRALLPNLRSGELRKIVNVTTNLSSIAGNTEGGFYGYRESKAALNMFTRSLAAELGTEGFICIVLHPGWVKTDMGGAQAPLNVRESVEGMRRVIEALSFADNGSFWTYAGEPMPW